MPCARLVPMVWVALSYTSTFEGFEVTRGLGKSSSLVTSWVGKEPSLDEGAGKPGQPGRVAGGR